MYNCSVKIGIHAFASLTKVFEHVMILEDGSKNNLMHELFSCYC